MKYKNTRAKAQKEEKDKVITNLQNNEIFPVFESERDRLKYISNNYNDLSIADAFSKYYNKKKVKNIDPSVNNVITMEVGQVYLGNIKDLEKGNITFELPGVNEEIICHENLNNHLDALRNYAMNHNNTMYFEVREIQNDKVYVSILNGYYKIWEHKILNAAQQKIPVKVHINSLVKGGYSCVTKIDELNNLLGTDSYVCNVFIPGSHIILNIETDFEKWLDKDVYIIPDKFVDFKVDRFTKQIEKSLIGSRKKWLQQKGEENIYMLWKNHQLAEKLGGNSNNIVLDGKVTGIINSSNKTGVFIEIPDKFITGLMPLEDASDLVNYRPGEDIKVKIKEFETIEGAQPFVLDKDGSTLRKCNTRIVFDVA